MGGAEISVDLETGEIKLEKYVTVADVGKAINPLQAEGQDEGAAIQGLGPTLFESLVYEQRPAAQRQSGRLSRAALYRFAGSVSTRR